LCSNVARRSVWCTVGVGVNKKGNALPSKGCFGSFKALAAAPEEKQLSGQFEQALRQWAGVPGKVAKERAG
jgi:hypothetical protein